MLDYKDIGTERWVNDYLIADRVFSGYRPVFPLQIKEVNPSRDSEVDKYGILMVKTGDTVEKLIDEAIASKRPVLEADILYLMTASEAFRLFLGKVFGWRFKVYPWYRWFLSVILRRRIEGEKCKYGPNWTINKYSIAFILFLPLWIYPEQIFEEDDTWNLLKGKRILVLRIRCRLSWKRKRFFFNHEIYKVPRGTHLIMTREQVEDGRPNKFQEKERALFDKIMSEDIEWLPEEKKGVSMREEYA